MEKIHVSFIKDLRNREFSELIRNLGDLFAKIESENSSLIKATKRLQSHKKELLKLKDTKPRHYLTRIINEKVNNRTEYLSCLRMRIEAALMSPLPEERVAAEKLMYWIDPYRKALFKPSIRVQGQLVEFLKHDRKESSDIQRFTTLLNLDQLFEILVNITEEINSLITERVRDKTRRSINGKEVREIAYHDLQVILGVLKAIYNLSDSTEEKEKMAELSGEINEHLTGFRRELRSRNTKRSNKKEVEVAEKELISVESDEGESLSVPTNDKIKLDEADDLSLSFSTQAFKGGDLEAGVDAESELNNGRFCNSNNIKDLYLARKIEKKNGDGKLSPILEEVGL